MHVQHSMAQWCTYCLLSDSLQVVSPVFSRLLFDFFSISCFLPSRLLFSASAPSLSSSHLISPQFTSFLLITSIIRFSTVKHSTVILCSFWIFTFPHNDISPSLLFIVLYCSLLFCFVFSRCNTYFASFLSVRLSVCPTALPLLFLFYSTPYMTVNANTETREYLCTIYSIMSSPILFYTISSPSLLFSSVWFYSSMGSAVLFNSYPLSSIVTCSLLQSKLQQSVLHGILSVSVICFTRNSNSPSITFLSIVMYGIITIHHKGYVFRLFLCSSLCQ